MGIQLNFFLLLLLVPPLLVIEGIFAGSEIAIFSADRVRLKNAADQGKSGAKTALQLTRHPERVLSTTLFVTSLCVITISSLITLYCLGHPIQWWFFGNHTDIVAVLVTSPLVVVLGELIPKTLYQKNAEKLAPIVAPIIDIAYWVFYPFTRFLSAYTSRLSRTVGPVEELLTGKKRSTREELQILLNYGKRESEIKSGAKLMIRRILEFQEAEAKNALIPLVRVEAIEDTSTVREALEKFERNRHSRMPVFSDRVDNIVGILESASLFAASDLAQPITKMISEAHYVAESQSLEDVLIGMRRDDHDMVVVVDEHGGATGVLTFEDIAEEIVGEIQDEYDGGTTPHYKELSETSWLVQARMEIEQINETLKLDLPDGDYETLSGFLLQQFGRIPEQRDELFFNTASGAFKFTIRQATERHIESVVVEKLDS
jgi:CBS domain containing-hemolysin-like protein